MANRGNSNRGSWSGYKAQPLEEGTFVIFNINSSYDDQLGIVKSTEMRYVEDERSWTIDVNLITDGGSNQRLMEDIHQLPPTTKELLQFYFDMYDSRGCGFTTVVLELFDPPSTIKEDSFQGRLRKEIVKRLRDGNIYE